jgi:hypothetical protein
MRMLATLAVIAVGLGFTHEARAQGTYYAWCARYDAYAYNCGFTTFQQCQATVSGAGGFCYQNPMPAPFVQSRATHKRKHRRHY